MRKFVLKEIKDSILEENRYIVHESNNRFRIFDSKRMRWLQINSGNVVFILRNGNKKYVNSIQKLLAFEYKIEKLSKVQKRFINKVRNIKLAPDRYVAYETGDILDLEAEAFKIGISSVELTDLNGDKHKILKSTVIFQAFNPDTVILHGDKITFKDGNSLNLEINNLKLVKKKGTRRCTRKLGKPELGVIKEYINKLSDKDLINMMQKDFGITIWRNTLYKIRKREIYRKDFKDFRFI